MMALASMASTGPVPVKEIPGTYGPPLLGAIADRFEYFVTQGVQNFFQKRIDKYESTVFRVNMPPGPPFVSDPRVIMLLDAKSFPVLHDLSKVEKKNVLTGSYMPSTDFTGGYRVAVYMDPSEEKHKKLKGFCLEVLRNGRDRYFPEFSRAFDELCAALEKEMESSGKASFGEEIEQLIFNFLCRSITRADPITQGLGSSGPSYVKTWLGVQLAPILSSGFLPKILDELTIHSIPLPFWLVSGYYDKLFIFLWTHATPLLEMAEKQFGLKKEEACHDLLFNIAFNAFGGMIIMFPNIVKYVARAGEQLQRDLGEEVREAVRAHGGLNARALESMGLVRSTVYEVLRIDPPVPLQYARAKTDLVVESHHGFYGVKKGEMLGGYQPFATKDPKVFDKAEEFVPRRFIGEEGEKMLKYVLWSNGYETNETSTDNKQCAGKDIVVLVARLFVAHLFLRYNSFAIDKSSSSVTFTTLKKAIF